MKAKDKETLAVLRMLKAAFQNEQIKTGKELSEDEELTLLSREMKLVVKISLNKHKRLSKSLENIYLNSLLKTNCILLFLKLLLKSMRHQ